MSKGERSFIAMGMALLSIMLVLIVYVLSNYDSIKQNMTHRNMEYLNTRSALTSPAEGQTP